MPKGVLQAEAEGPGFVIDFSLFRHVERTAAILGLVAVLLSILTLDVKFISGVFIGAAVGWLNLVAVRTLAARMVRANAIKGLVLGAFLLKFSVLAALVAVAILVLGVDAIGFLVGFFTMVLAVMVVPAVIGSRTVSGDKETHPEGDSKQDRVEP